MRLQPEVVMWIAVLGVWCSAVPFACARELPPTLRDRPAAPLSQAIAPHIVDLQRQQSQSPAAVLDRLAAADVVYLGEVHDRAADHRIQLEILQALRSRRPLIIGMEMFQRPFQAALDDYIAGRIPEPELVKRTEYTTRWRFDWELYAPILRFARQHQLPVVALNPPGDVVRTVARQGLEGLKDRDRQWIPAPAEIRLEPESYRERLRQLYDSFHHSQGNTASFDRFFLAQVVWDETMAEQVAIALKQSPDSLIVVLAGQGHILYRDGIPQRVARRVPQRAQRPLRQVTVILNPEADIPPTAAVADYFWSAP